ncbi:unnamed protein product [Adineta ricciae]|uniref:Uncharacterized protein n=1 Tax=Adineta ricciae TaxID=249248 RepID=A0A814IKS6_ADIRI|nr:unnamed protein product [Adineta ricciae]
MKNDIYDQCNSVLRRSVSLGSLEFNSTIGEYYFTNYTITLLSDVYLILQFSSKLENNHEFYRKLVSSYLLSKNLEKLPFKQQLRTNILIFLSEHFSNMMYERLTMWFKSIYEPYTRRMHIIPTNDHREDMTLKFILNHTKYNSDIHLDTILFFIEDNLILQSEMLFDTIEFFVTHEPCFVYHPNYFHGCQFEGILDTNKYTTIVFGKTRLWRSISPKTFTYTGRLRTFLAFEDLFIHSNDKNRSINELIQTYAEKTTFFCAVPSYSTQFERLLFPDGIRITADDDMSIYFHDWSSLARQALTEAQTKDAFPIEKIDEGTLFS